MKKGQQQFYLVQPNQGILGPSDSISVTIIMVNKYKEAILHRYDNVKLHAQENAIILTKDKFLVQSCALPNRFALSQSGANKSKEHAIKIRTLWQKNCLPRVNKNLMVEHSVLANETSRTP